jgi:hypothetical protein
MKSNPRTTLRLSATLILAFASLLMPAPALSQQRGRAKPASSSTQSKAAERARRALAASLLTETADKARSFDDLFYRAKVQMLAADALWPQDAPRAYAIFRHAWEAAAASDKAETEEAAREAAASPTAFPKVTDARDEVLTRAAARDARLAEIFLRDLARENDEGAAVRNEPARRTAWRKLSASGERRLALASELLQAHETLRAVEVAGPLLNEGVSAPLIVFIMRLRDQSMSDGDAFYLRLLERAAADPQTDANAVLLLSSPFVSPGLLVGVDEFGSLQFSVISSAKAYAAANSVFTARTWETFYNLAASVLSRPLPPRDTLTMQDLVARFYAAGRLLPLFENSSSPQAAAYAPLLRARHSELFNEIEAGRREQVSSQFGAGSMARDAGYTDPLRTQARELAEATDPAERSSLALSVIRTAVRNKFWDRARRAAAEIEDERRRQSALTFIQVHQIKDILHAYEDPKEDDYEEVAKFVRGASVPPFAKAWGLAQVAVIAARKRDARATQTVSELIDEAESHAARSPQGRPERVAAYGVVTILASRLSAARAWELLHEMVKAANSADDFTGDEASLDLSPDADSVAASDDFKIEAEVFRLDEIFATMARLDFDKALAEARALSGDVPQALATIAVAKSRVQNPEVRSQNKN